MQVARGNKMCDRFEDASVIQTTAGHHIYKRHFTNTIGKTRERHSRAEKNPTMTIQDSFTVAITENNS